MGFSVVAAVLVTTTAFAFAGGALVTVAFETTNELQEAEESAIERLRLRYETDLVIGSVDYTPPTPLLGIQGSVLVTVTNEGPNVLRPRLVSVVLDGKLVDENVTSRAVSGVLYQTDVWGPGDELRLRVRPVDEAPTRVTLVTEHGSITRWRVA